MAQVLVRGISDTVLAHLRERARHNRRSLEAELRVVLSDAAGTSRVESLNRLLAIRRQIDGLRLPDSTDDIRQDRAR